MLYEEIDNMVWNGDEKEVSQWCERNKVYDVITEAENREIWQIEDPAEDETVRLNGKYVWETAKRESATSSMDIKTSSTSRHLANTDA